MAGNTTENKTADARVSKRRSAVANRGGRRSGSNTVSTAALGSRLAPHWGVSIEEATARCRDVIEAIRASLLAGQPVNLWKIGTLSAYQKQGYRYRSPGDGEMKTVPARRYVRFALSSTLRDAINNG